jgi:putative tricarboxylic transport membrane protein
MGLGAAMAFCALLLVLSTRRHPPLNGSDNDAFVDDTTSDDPGSYKNLLVTAFLSVAYAAGLVGQIPFYAATAIFIFSFSVYFLWPGNGADSKAKFRIGLLCAVYALVFAVGISALFRYGFLVRLP